MISLTANLKRKEKNSSSLSSLSQISFYLHSAVPALVLVCIAHGTTDTDSSVVLPNTCLCVKVHGVTKISNSSSKWVIFRQIWSK